jgi:hypothetical protein
LHELPDLQCSFHISPEFAKQLLGKRKGLTLWLLIQAIGDNAVAFAILPGLQRNAELLGDALWCRWVAVAQAKLVFIAYRVLGYLPDERKADGQAAMKAAFRLEADKGIGKLKKLAEWLGREYPSAVGSLLEGLEEVFTINRLGSPRQLCRCLGSTNVIESPYSGVRHKTHCVTG